MAVKMDVNSKSFWNHYLLAAQIDAGEALGAQKNEKTFAKHQTAGFVLPQIRPILLNLNLFSPPQPSLFNLDFSTHHTTVIAPGPKSREEREQEEADCAKCVGAILCVAASCLFGYAYNVYSRQQETLEGTRTLANTVNDDNWRLAKYELGGSIRMLVANQLSIDELNASRINNYALAVFVLLVAAALLVVGGCIVVPALIAFGEIAVVAAGAIAAWNLGSHWNDEEINRPRYQLVARIADNLFRNQLHSFTEEMMWLSKPTISPPAYNEPLYPDFAPSAPPA